MTEDGGAGFVHVCVRACARARLLNLIEMKRKFHTACHGQETDELQRQ
jgi:hypothetical protein